MQRDPSALSSDSASGRRSAGLATVSSPSFSGQTDKVDTPHRRALPTAGCALLLSLNDDDS